MTNLAAERCETCRFGNVVWRAGDPYEWENEWGDRTPGARPYTHMLCRREPPMIVPEHGSMWPAVNPEDWCGEFQAREVSHDQG